MTTKMTDITFTQAIPPGSIPAGRTTFTHIETEMEVPACPVQTELSHSLQESWGQDAGDIRYVS